MPLFSSLLSYAPPRVVNIIITPATKQLNDVILNRAKNLVFSCCYEILHAACPELNYEILRYAQNDKERKAQNDHYACPVNILRLLMSVFPIISRLKLERQLEKQ